jgi:hypothetical protein
MSEPIVERIALWLKTALAQITTEGGYNQTLVVSRPEDVFVAGESVGDLSTILVQGACKADRAPTVDATGPQLFWLQTFEANVYLIAAAGLSVDTRGNRVVADIHKRIGVETAQLRTNKGRCCSGLAYRIDLLAPLFVGEPDLNATRVIVPVAIAYHVNARDPYSQS